MFSALSAVRRSLTLLPPNLLRRLLFLDFGDFVDPGALRAGPAGGVFQADLNSYDETMTTDSNQNKLTYYSSLKEAVSRAADEFIATLEDDLSRMSFAEAHHYSDATRASRCVAIRPEPAAIAD